MKRHVQHVIVVAVVPALIVIGLGAYAYPGLHNIGADDHHWRVT